MFLRHKSELWQASAPIAEGEALSPVFNFDNPNYDDRVQEFVILSWLDNSEPDGSIHAQLEMSTDGVNWLPGTLVTASFDPQGLPVPFAGLGPHVSAQPMLPSPGGTQPFSSCLSAVFKFVRLRVFVAGTGANQGSALFHVASNGPLRVLPVVP